MFEEFRKYFKTDLRDDLAVDAWLPAKATMIEGFEEFAQEFSGSSFNGGVYRFHDSTSGEQARALIEYAFPAYSMRSIPFGYDWLGRQFASDLGRVVNGQPQTLLFEPGTGFVLEVPVDFEAFHDEELIHEADAAVAASFFAEWVQGNAESLPISRSQCVGYDIPLFLGGTDSKENMSLTDMDVYWTFCADLKSGTSGLQPNTPIVAVKLTGDHSPRE